MGGGVKYRQPAFVTRTLEPPKIKQCTFVTFPKYVWATKCYAYSWYTAFQKYNMVSEKLEVGLCKPFVVICGSHHISGSRAHSNNIPTAVPMFSRYSSLTVLRLYCRV